MRGKGQAERRAADVNTAVTSLIDSDPSSNASFMTTYRPKCKKRKPAYTAVALDEKVPP